MEPDKAPIALLIGVAALIGAAALAWLSAPVTLTLARSGPGLATASIDSHLVALVPFDHVEVPEIRAARVVRSEVTGPRSRPYDRLVLDGAGGPVDVQALRYFTRQAAPITAFLADGGQDTFVVSSIDPGAEKIRFVVSQLAWLFLALLGGGVLWAAFAALWPRSRA